MQNKNNSNNNQKQSSIKLFSLIFILTVSFFGTISMVYISYNTWDISTLGFLYGMLNVSIFIAGIVSSFFIWNIEEIASIEVMKLSLIAVVVFILLWALITLHFDLVRSIHQIG